LFKVIQLLQPTAKQDVNINVQIERDKVSYTYGKSFKCTFNIVVPGEHLLYKYTVIYEVARCSDTKADVIKLYYLKEYNQLFQFVQLSPPLAVLCEVVNFFATFYCNFIDPFVMVFSMALSSRFRLLNNHLRMTLEKVLVDFITISLLYLLFLIHHLHSSVRLFRLL
jgi:hypothetical protein